MFLIFEDFSELNLRRRVILRLHDLNRLSGLYRVGGFYLMIGGVALLVVLVVALVVS